MGQWTLLLKTACFLTEEPLSWREKYDISLAQLFPTFGWGDIVWPSYQKIIDVRQPGSAWIANKYIRDSRKLEDVANRTLHGHHMFTGMTAKDCDLANASKKVDKILETFSKLSQKTLIYLTPTTPNQAQNTAACFVPAVKKMLLSKKSRNVAVLVGDWKSYDLDYPDFVLPNKKEVGTSTIDMNHPNYQGALKVTKKIADEIVKFQNENSR